MNPSLKTLRDFVFLIENQVLEVPELRILAVYHRGSRRAYREARAFLREYPRTWLSIERAKCRVSVEEVFADNPCREEYRRLVRRSRGMIFTGGTDLLPALYGEPTQLTTRVTRPGRNVFEVSALYHLLRSKPGAHQALLEHDPEYPILAICLGLQTLNVAQGGTLHQDIPSEVYGVRTAEEVLALPETAQHACYANHASGGSSHALWTTHPVRLDASWRWGQPPPSGRVEAISFHHQAIDRLGADLRVSATSLDKKIVEGVEHELYPNVFGVQFHPEYASAWTAQSTCRLPQGRAAKISQYQLESDMVAFYEGFWKSFAGLLRDREQGRPRSTPRRLGRAAEARGRAAPRNTIEAKEGTLFRAQKSARATMRRGLALFRDDGRRSCPLLGELSSPITSKVGLRSSKVATCDSEFAAVLVELLHDAGIRKGDSIGVAFSGSFPALNLATVAAAEALKLRPVVVTSLSSSMFGANRPEQTWLDMESRLVREGVIQTRSRAATLGGRDDNGAGLAPAGLKLLRGAVKRNEVPLLETRSLSDAVRARLELYERGSGRSRVKAFVNVGGGKASVGTRHNKRRFRPGLNTRTPSHLDPAGVMAHMSEAGLPVIYLGNIRRLCREHDLACFPGGADRPS